MRRDMRPVMKPVMKPVTTAMAAAAVAVLAAASPAEAQVSAVCSGIGEEGRAEAETVPHSLKLVYAEPDGSYLGAVETRITGEGGELVNVRCPGPWVLVDLPPGSYEVTATFKGETKSRRVTVGGSGTRQQVFTF